MRIAMLLVLLAAMVGCASDHQAGGGPATDLIVHVGVFGGPMRPNGEMAASNAPQRDARITVTDRSGHTWTARTNRLGIASFAVPAGSYQVHGPCEPTKPEVVAVRSGHIARVQVQCDVP
jgi:hypothetical protein